MAAAPRFLTLDAVLLIHERQRRRFGGGAGVRDMSLLASALGMPSATYDGVYLHGTLAEMAAAYLFHLARNHPFVDGNKRVALAASLVFLGLNGHWVEADDDELYRLVIDVVSGARGKAEAASFLRSHLRPARAAR